MNSQVQIPCMTQFTVREFEEYLFHREGIRVVVRRLTDHEETIHAFTRMETSYFEIQSRCQNNAAMKDNELTTSFIGKLFKTTNVVEFSIVFGDGSTIDLMRTGEETYKAESSSAMIACLYALEAGDIRRSYTPNKSDNQFTFGMTAPMSFNTLPTTH